MEKPTVEIAWNAEDVLDSNRSETLPDINSQWNGSICHVGCCFFRGILCDGRHGGGRKRGISAEASGMMQVQDSKQGEV